MRIAVIGCSGNKHSLTLDQYYKAKEILLSKIQFDDCLISGGSSWMDHLAVELFLENRVRNLLLYLPCSIIKNNSFVNPLLNSLHIEFSKVLGRNSVKDILLAQSQGAQLSYSNGFYARNAKIASNCDVMYAFSPYLDEGTKHTFELCRKKKFIKV